MIPPTGGVQRPPLPTGPRAGRCVRIIDLGTQKSTFQGETKFKRKVQLAFELPTVMRKFREDGPEEPAMISKRYTYSFDKKATLRKDLEAWRGRAFTEDEAKRFDIAKLAAAAALLNISRSEDGQYDNIAGITGLPDGMTCPPQIIPSTVFSLQKEFFDQTVFDKLPKGTRATIAQSPEFKAAGGVYDENGPSGGSSAGPDGGDDIPF